MAWHTVVIKKRRRAGCKNAANPRAPIFFVHKHTTNRAKGSILESIILSIKRRVAAKSTRQLW